MNMTTFRTTLVAIATVGSHGSFVPKYSHLPRKSSLNLKSYSVLSHPDISVNKKRGSSLIPSSPNLTSDRYDSSSTLYSNTPLRPLVICGPSGAGKGTIIARYLDSCSSNDSSETGLPKFGFTVSHTTREPRPHEIDGIHYNFCTREFMLEKISSGDFFVEHAEVHGNLYGTSIQAIMDVARSNTGNCGAETHCLLDVDIQGVRSIKEFQARQQTVNSFHDAGNNDNVNQQKQANVLPELKANFVFIAPPSLSILHQRLLSRGTETEETMKRRLENAKYELKYGMEKGNFDAIIVNDDLDRACNEFERIIREIYKD